ncbi:carbohydrate ABC transporter permease [Cohnella thailandensis]|uniref:Carbohydrate ABC transporter permease n=1 Tax=Cohnella thailandensis TaxID=557557 RepID=A0A841SVW5_9BACL|nr:carbohydrate ABC transporter permease [Cohnella thailandensis]MBB6632851.1 carbohydrate ABC transporter permease [Cohnella thailandensis]MBP1975455.1 putative aldouronate transport system permease protein [Cohnella thailandensis]
MIQDKSWGSRLFDGVNIALLALVGLVTVLPFVHVLAGSFTTTAELARKQLVLIPTEFSFDAYRYIFSTSTVIRSIGVSVFITVAGTLFSMLLTVLMAFGLSKKTLRGRQTIMFLVVFTMLFNGGLIPSFIVVKSLGLIDSYGALIIPSAMSAFNLIIMRNFFQNLPEGLEESAKIDGAGYWSILFRIVIPLSMPAIATISLFYAVNYWNTYFQAVMYINDAAKWPVQVILRQIVILAGALTADTTGWAAEDVLPPAQSIKMAVIVVATVPILIVYPFLQKHFAKGALLGSIKG